MKQPLRLGEGMQTEQGWHATDCQPIVSRRSIRVHRIHKRVKTLVFLVGATGFEPATPCAQGRCATRLRYAPTPNIRLYCTRQQCPRAPLSSGQRRSRRPDLVPVYLLSSSTPVILLSPCLASPRSLLWGSRRPPIAPRAS